MANWWWPVNFAMQMIEFLAKTVSHGMRLFGNMTGDHLVLEIFTDQGIGTMVR